MSSHATSHGSGGLSQSMQTVHRRVFELPQRLFSNRAALPSDGRQARFARTHQNAARLRRNLPDERQLHASQLRLSRTDQCRLRRGVRALRHQL